MLRVIELKLTIMHAKVLRLANDLLIWRLEGVILNREDHRATSWYGIKSSEAELKLSLLAHLAFNLVQT